MYAHQTVHGHDALARVSDHSSALKKIMVVDDDPLLLEIFSEYLGAQGHLVTPVNDSSLIGEALKRQAFDFIICDYNMPDFNFEKDLLALSSQDGFPQIILVSGDPRLADEGQFSFPVLIKPFDFKQLRAVLLEPIKKTPAIKICDNVYQ